MRCFNHIKALANLPKEVLSDEEREAIYNYAKEHAKNPNLDQYVADMSKKMNERLNKVHRRNLLIDQKTKEFKNFLDKYDSKSRGLSDILKKGERVLLAEKATGIGKYMHDIQRKSDQHLDFFHNPDNAMHLINAFDDRFNQRETRDKIPQMAKDIVDIYLNVNKDQLNMAKSLGGMTEELQDHLSIQSHSRDKMLRSFENRFDGMKHRLDLIKSGVSPFDVAQRMRALARKTWIEYIKPRLNLARTFGELQEDGTYKLKMSDAEIDASLDKSYTHITLGREENINVGAGAYGSDRIYHFNDKKSWFEYNDKFGKGSLADAMTDTIMRNGEKIGLLQHFGPSPRKSWTDVMNHAIESSAKSKQPESDKTLMRHARIFNALTKANDLVPDTAFDKIYKSFKVMTYLSKLGFSNFSSYPDLALQTLRYAKTGENYFTRVGWTVRDAVQTLPFNKMRKFVLQDVAVGMEKNPATYLNRYSDVNNPAMAKLLKMYFTMTHQHMFDEGLRTSTTTTFSSHLYNALGEKYHTLDETYRQSLESYGIGEKEHELLSKYKNDMKVYGNRRFVFPEIADVISKKDMESYAGKTLTDNKFKEYQRHIRSSLTEMYQDHAAYVQLSPTEYDRAIASIQNKNVPALFRTMAKMYMDFKWFALAQTRKVLGQIYLDNTTQSLGRSILNASFKQHMLLMQYVLSSMAMSWGADSIISLLKYGHVENPLDHPIRESFRALMGPLGLLGSIVATTFGNDRRLSYDKFIGPVGKTILDTTNLIKTLTTYDSHGKRMNYHDKAISSLLKYTDRHVIPHVWWLELLYRHHIFNPLMNKVYPSYLIRQHRRFMKENPHAKSIPFLEQF